MTEKTFFYALTFFGLYLELAGAFLLSAEAIGADNLLKIADKLRRHRVIRFIVLVVVSVIVVAISKFFRVLHLNEALVIILSLGILSDFSPKIIQILVQRLKKGTVGIIGFLLFAIGFSIQAYVNLSLLY